MAVLLLAAQCLAVAHYHPRAAVKGYSDSTGVSLDGGLCALCLLHCNTPAIAAAIPSPIAPANLEHFDLYAAQSWPLYSFNSYLPGRAPPALL